MIKSFRKWLVNLAPVWARASLQAENEALEDENRRLRAEIDRLNAYIQGMQCSIKAMRKIIINAGGDKP